MGTPGNSAAALRLSSPPSDTGTRAEVRREARRSWLPDGIVLLAYGLLLLVTRTLDQGDTSVYGDDLVDWLRGRPSTLWEFGHAIWRPIAAAVLSVAHPDLSRVTDGVLFEQAVGVLTGMSVLGGALAVVLFRAWLARLGIAGWATVATTIAFAAASAFLGYAQTGASYVPGVAMLLLALWALAGDEQQSDRLTITLATLGFALAVLLWVPLVLAVPGSALSTILLRGDTPRRRRIAIAACVASGLLTIASYVVIAALAGVRSAADLQAWMQQSSHGIRGIGGVQRAVIGFGRSLVNMDRLGLVAKRYLLHDAYNPATLGDVLRAGLARLAVVYAAVGVMLLMLARRPGGRRAIAFLTVTAIPVVGLALKWQGGDLERWLALTPALFLALAVTLEGLTPRAQRIAGGTIAALLVASNAPAISRGKHDAQCAALAVRLEAVPIAAGRPTLVFTPHELDEITTFQNRCPDAALFRRESPPQAFGLVMANTESAAEWREELATRAERAWSEGGRVWIARRTFAASPSPTWKWVEGDDPRFRWTEFREYFTQVDLGPPVGGDDGFVEVLPTARTRAAVQRMRTVLSRGA